MRVGLMVGSDKERPADRLTGLLDDGKAAESDGFASFWIPQVPGYLTVLYPGSGSDPPRARVTGGSRPGHSTSPTDPAIRRSGQHDVGGRRRKRLRFWRFSPRRNRK